MIKYSSLRGKWEDDLIFSFQNLDKPTTAKGKVISMQIWEEGLVSELTVFVYCMINGNSSYSMHIHSGILSLLGFLPYVGFCVSSEVVKESGLSFFTNKTKGTRTAMLCACRYLYNEKLVVHYS